MNNITFIGCEALYDDAKIVVFGAPMDTTTTNRPGTRFGANQARLESEGLETYSPYQNLDLEDYMICDDGDLNLTFGNVNSQLKTIYDKTMQILTDNKMPFMIGGEHLVSLPAIQAVSEKYQDVVVLHFDAHADLRTNYMGEKLSHSTVMYHVHNLDNVNSLYQFGIRSGTRSEFEYAAKNTCMEKFGLTTVKDIVENVKDKNVYISIDLDVLDPSIFPGTGTPEPGGVSFQELQNAILELSKLNNIVGMDVVELAPQLDVSGVSNAVCAKVIRELLLIKGGKE